MCGGRGTYDHTHFSISYNIYIFFGYISGLWMHTVPCINQNRIIWLFSPMLIRNNFFYMKIQHIRLMISSFCPHLTNKESCMIKTEKSNIDLKGFIHQIHVLIINTKDMIFSLQIKMK